jgi:hypothetical protein
MSGGIDLALIGFQLSRSYDNFTHHLFPEGNVPAGVTSLRGGLRLMSHAFAPTRLVDRLVARICVFDMDKMNNCGKDPRG